MLRPLNVSLAIGAAVVLGMLLSLPFPPTEGDRVPATTLATTLLSQLVALLLSRRRPRIAALALSVLGVLAVAGLYSTLHFVSTGIARLDRPCPDSLIALFASAASIASVWHGQSLWRARIGGDPTP